jgi:8-oxo-dGTP pyrophosphatase MutT (NUDIX family)
MKVLYVVLAFSSLTLVASACGKDAQVNLTQTQSQTQSQPHPQTSTDQRYSFPVVRTQLSPHAPFYQFDEKIGNFPQSTFDPTYKPKSVTRRSQKLTRESGGALIYTVAPTGDIYILIGLERSDVWNFTRGSVDTGDSYVTAAANELHQETGGVYQVSENVLLHESYDVYYSTTRFNYACTFFVKLDYIPSEIIKKTAAQHPDPHFREMKDYAWIRLKDFTSALDNLNSKFDAKTIEGQVKTFDFYQFSFNVLLQAHGKGILDSLQ